MEAAEFLTFLLMIRPCFIHLCYSSEPLLLWYSKSVRSSALIFFCKCLQFFFHTCKNFFYFLHMWWFGNKLIKYVIDLAQTLGKAFKQLRRQILHNGGTKFFPTGKN